MGVGWPRLTALGAAVKDKMAAVDLICSFLPVYFSAGDVPGLFGSVILHC